VYIHQNKDLTSGVNKRLHHQSPDSYQTLSHVCFSLHSKASVVSISICKRTGPDHI
jgi:hypothetical protein